MEGMDMDLETLSCVWNTLAHLDPSLVAPREGDPGEGSDPPLGGLSSG